MHVDRIGCPSEPARQRELEVVAIPVLHVVHRCGHLVMKDAVVLRVALPLLRIRLALERLLAVDAAPSRQEADARSGRCFEVDDEVAIVLVLARSVRFRECRKTEP